jgi:4-hydroxybenzoyl-CoA thioesterase
MTDGRMLTSVRNTRIEWCHCDPAGIIFYPRYFDLFETSTIVLIERALGMTQSEYLKAYRFAGHPLVVTRARFRQATRFGDEVAIETKLIECGRSSFKLEHRLTKAGALAVEASETRVWAINAADHPARLKPQPIPPEVLARFRGERVLPREAGEVNG